jgi:hypothetical protein
VRYPLVERDPVDDDVEEGADQQPEDGDGGDEETHGASA